MLETFVCHIYKDKKSVKIHVFSCFIIAFVPIENISLAFQCTAWLKCQKPRRHYFYQQLFLTSLFQ